MDLGDCVARFCWAWPGEFRGGDIPWALFWLLYERLHVVLAVDRVTQTRAVSLAWGGKEGDTMRLADVREAFGHG